MSLFSTAESCGTSPYAGGELAKGLADSYSNTIKARIARAVEQAEQSLNDVKRAQEIFAKYPEMEELLNILQKGRI